MISFEQNPPCQDSFLLLLAYIYKQSHLVVSGSGVFRGLFSCEYDVV